MSSSAIVEPLIRIKLRTLSLLDLLLDANDEVKDELCVSVNELTSIQQHFVLRFIQNDDLEKLFNARLEKTDDAHICVEKDSIKAKVSDVVEMQKQLIEELNQKDVFDYSISMNFVVSRVCQIISHLMPIVFSLEDLMRISCRESVPFGEEWSAKFDIAFEGGAEGGNLIVYPNANSFNEQLLSYCKNLSPPGKEGRTFIEFFYRCWRAPSHEFVHCLQSRLKQRDTNPLSWSAEHDASYLAGSLLLACLSENADLIAFWDELWFAWAEELRGRSKKYDENVEEQYKIWRDSFGLKAPSQVITETEGATFYAKDRLAFEATRRNMESLKHQLNACFDGGRRTGDVYIYEVQFQGDAKVDPEKDDLFVQLKA